MVKHKIKLSLAIFFLGSMLLFVKSLYGREIPPAVWWFDNFFVQVYFLLFFGGAFAFLALMISWAVNCARNRTFEDRRKLLVSMIMFFFGWLFLYVNLWHTANTSFIEGEMWWQYKILEITYRFMFVVGFISSAVILIKIGITRIKMKVSCSRTDG